LGSPLYNRGVSRLFATPINATTRYCAVYGYPIKHSASPAMQNAGMAALGLNWRYLAFPVHPDHLRQCIVGAGAMQFIGLNLTVPHKLLALEFVDALDESARTWGAVNTIRFEAQTAEGTWTRLADLPEPLTGPIRSHGFNTDADAIVQALKEDLAMELSGTRVLLLGAGGAGRTAALKLASQGVRELFLVNRTRSKAETVAGEIRPRYPQVKVTVGYPTGTIDLVLNATSLGLRSTDEIPFNGDEFQLSQARAAYDMIYRPAETAFLAAARSAGCRTANGLGMLLYQGASALQLWTGRNPPIDVMRDALRQSIYG
jgi:shikimate dehydrogenase